MTIDDIIIKIGPYRATLCRRNEKKAINEAITWIMTEENNDHRKTWYHISKNDNAN